jgi:alkylation response protein AidB-like acyl-CoA dehydrogenase
MDLSFTEEQEILRKFAKDFLDVKFPKKVIREVEETDAGYLTDAWKEMAELGWMGLPFSEKYGGAGMTFLDLAVLLEEMGKASMPGPYFATVMLGAFPISDFGTEEQKGKYLTGVSAGNMIMTMALTESDGTCSPESIKTKAVSAGDGWSISGTKLFVPFAHVSDYILCVARTDESKKAEEGITVFVVDSKAQGVECTLLESIAGKLCEVSFNNVKVSKDDMVGALNEGWNLVKSTVDKAEVANCCEMVGLAQQALDMTVDYAKERKQFGKPIGSFQIIQHYCADMLINLEGMRLSTYKAAWKLSEGLDFLEDIAVAKAWAIQAADQLIGLAHQVHGAIGVTIEYDLHYYTRRLKAAELSFGSVGFYHELLAQGMGL